MGAIEDLFSLTLPLTEILLRGSVVYLALFFLFRFLLRRDMGSVGLADVLFIVLIADASQGALVGEGTTISDGLLLIAVIAGWNHALDWLAYRYDFARRIIQAPTITLIRNGRVQEHNLHRQLISIEELKGKLREQGIDDVSMVKHASLEASGEVSVVKAERRHWRQAHVRP